MADLPVCEKEGETVVTVYERKKVPENCSTCLYGPNAISYDGKQTRMMGCGHAGRQGDWMCYAMGLRKCPSYWLDQNRFQRAE